MGATIEEYYKTYFTYELLEDIFAAIHKCIDKIDRLTANVPDGKTYSIEQYAMFLRSVGLDSMIKSTPVLFNDTPFDMGAILAKEMQRPILVSAYNTPILVAKDEEPPSESEVLEQIRDFTVGIEFLNYHIHIDMAKIIVAEAKHIYPPGTENRVLNVIAAIKQYVRYI